MLEALCVAPIITSQAAHLKSFVFAACQHQAKLYLKKFPEQRTVWRQKGDVGGGGNS